MMRAVWLAVGALVIAIAIQLSVLNGLRLPGGGVPDLVLVLVAALAVAEGPLPGVLFGFAAGLCLDVAPPGSPVVGLYALVFCLAGWAAGRLSPVSGHSDRSSSGLVSVGLVAVVVAAAEALAAALSLVLAPAAVTLAQVRLVLPSTIIYDLILCPFVLYLVVLGSSLVADRTGSTRKFQGVVILGWNASREWQTARQAGSASASRAATRRKRLPDLHRGAARRGDGWVKANRIDVGARRWSEHGRGVPRLRPGHGVAGSASGLIHPRSRPAAGAAHVRFRQHGVAGSASGLIHPRSRPAAAVHVRFGAVRRHDGVVGGAAAHRPGVSRHPGTPGGRAVKFRPHAGAPAGSATHAPRLGPSRPPGSPRPARIRFGRHRGDVTVGNAPLVAPVSPQLRASRPARIRFGVRRGDRTIGHAPLTGRPTPQRRARIRFAGYRKDGTVGHVLTARRTRSAVAPNNRAAVRFGGHRGDATVGHTLGPSWPDALSAGTPVPVATGSLLAVSRPASGPRLKFGSGAAQVSRRPPAVPKFHQKSGLLRPARQGDAILPGGGLSERAAASRAHRPTPRLHLSGSSAGMLGGSGHGPRLGRPPGRTGKQPRFSYGRHSPLSVLAAGRLGHRLGGRWLARRRAGRRSGVWLLANRGGGPR